MIFFETQCSLTGIARGGTRA